MAKKNQSTEQSTQTPFENLGELINSKETRTLVVVDHLDKEVRVVSGIDEKKPDNPFTYVAPKAENKAAFIN